MAEKKSTQVVENVVKSVAAETIQSAGGLAGLLLIAKRYIFPNTSPDATPHLEGLQAYKGGAGQADDAMFDEAIAQAAELLEPSDTIARNTLMNRFYITFNAQSASARKDAILRCGLSESKIETKDKDGNTKIEFSNTRGITILKSWLQMDAPTLILALKAHVETFDIASERIKSIDNFCAKLNVEMEKIHGPLPATKTSDERKKEREERRKRIGTNPLSSLFSRRR